MNRKELWLIVGVSLTSSLATLGLFMAFWGGQTVLASDNPTPQKEVRAQKFVLVDKNGRDRAILDVADDGPALILVDKDGKPHTSLNLNGSGSPVSALPDKNRKPHPILRPEYGGDR
ncbi:MAG TPA: hypothetical protein VMN77_07100 [Nitrospiria bacterium]|jgi:hypothetical protein|nr:hypothetical protein [Nitrospiria bacterium]